MPQGQNPNLEQLPNFNGPAYQPIVNLIVQVQQITPQQAVEQLKTAHNTDRQARIEAWDDQVRQEQELIEQQALLQREEEERMRQEEEKAAEAERKELEKKKPKINNFDENRTGDEVIAPRPSPFAINKLKNFDYVELSYFTPEGCAAAMEDKDMSKAVADEAFGIAEVNGIMALRPIASLKAAKNVIRDRDLTWRQMTMGKNAMLHHMNKLGWPEKHINALAHFYFKLEDHPMRLRPNGDEILIIIQAVVRREWHDALERREGFNITNINETTLRTIADEYHDKKRAEGLVEVSHLANLYVSHRLTLHRHPLLQSLDHLQPRSIIDDALLNSNIGFYGSILDPYMIFVLLTRRI
ncbi:hypothetical protein BYT27DRAFT_7255060 [Phlegmacium glaucopus]|nr:hypothetical protein BYT27DRAFT_7255060 [Phlegmacium glaucopus]